MRCRFDRVFLATVELPAVLVVLAIVAFSLTLTGVQVLAALAPTLIMGSLIASFSYRQGRRHAEQRFAMTAMTSRAIYAVQNIPEIISEHADEMTPEDLVKFQTELRGAQEFLAKMTDDDA